MNGNEFSQYIDRLVAGEITEVDRRFVYPYLSRSLNGKNQEAELPRIGEALVKMAGSKNIKLRGLEKTIWQLVCDIPLHMSIETHLDGDEWIALHADTHYPESDRRICSQLLGLALKFLDLPNDGRKAAEVRRAGALEILADLITYYAIPEAKPAFLSSVRSKNMGECAAALEGLVNYYSFYDDEIESGLEEVLQKILAKTDDEEVAANCLYIQFITGVISDGETVREMDDWKERHRR